MSILTGTVQLLYGRTTYKTIGGVRIDAYVSENHKMTASVTQYPVEDGSYLNDHVNQEPDELTINGVVGVKSIYLFDISFPSLFSSRASDIFLKLETLKTDGEPIDVVTGLKLYEDMVITELNVGREAASGQGLEFTMNLKKLNVVTTEVTAIAKRKLGGKGPVKQMVKPKAEVGKKLGNFLDPIKAQVGV